MPLLIARMGLFVALVSAIPAAEKETKGWKRVGTLPAALKAAPMSGNPLVTADGFIFACSDSGVFRSQDWGRTWTPIWKSECMRLAMHAGDLFLGVSYQAFTSGNSGKTWEDLSEKLSLNTAVTAFAFAEGYLFAGVQSDGIYRSRDGVEWTRMNEGLTNNILLSMAAEGGQIYAGTPWGIYQSADAGGHWTLHERSPRYVREFLFHAGSIYVARQGMGVFRSPDHGKTWLRTHESLGDFDARGLAILDGELFATMGNVIARYVPGRDTWEAYGEALPAEAISLAAAGRCLVTSLADSSVWRAGTGCPK